MGKIGVPVAVRVVAHAEADHGQMESLAAVALEHATIWLGGELLHLTARGGVESGQITIFAQLAKGQSALVSVGSYGVGKPLVAFEVWGNRGMLSWEADPFSYDFHDAPRASKKSPVFRRRIQESLEFESVQAARASMPAKNNSTHDSISRKGQRPPYGILLVAGDHTHQTSYAEELAADERCHLIGLTDESEITPRRRELNARLADRLGIPVLPELSQALARDDVHIVSICAEPIRRGRIAVLAAHAGKHLYLDKPLAGSLADAEAIVAAVRQANVAAHMFSLVHGPAANRVRAIVNSGELGDLVAIHFDLCFAKGYGGTAKLGTPRKESAVPARLEEVDSKRELSNIGVYPLVELLSLTGRQARRVRATTANYFFAEHQKNDMEDFGQILLELDGGLVASLSVGRTGWQSNPGGGLNRTYLIGTKSCARVDAHRPRVEVWCDAEPWKPPPRDPNDPMGMWVPPPESPFAAEPRWAWQSPASSPGTADVRHFLDCIEQGRASHVTAELAADATRILMACYESASSQKTVAIPSS